MVVALRTLEEARGSRMQTEKHEKRLGLHNNAIYQNRSQNKMMSSIPRSTVSIQQVIGKQVSCLTPFSFAASSESLTGGSRIGTGTGLGLFLVDGHRRNLVSSSQVTISRLG